MHFSHLADRYLGWDKISYRNYIIQLLIVTGIKVQGLSNKTYASHCVYLSVSRNEFNFKYKQPL